MFKLNKYIFKKYYEIQKNKQLYQKNLNLI